MSNQPTLDDLAAEWLEVKARLDATKDILDDLTLEIVKLRGHPDSGTRSIETENFKVSITNPERVSITNADHLREAVAKHFSDDQWPFYAKPAIDGRKLNGLRNMRPDLYQLIAPAITVKRGKSSVVVKPKEASSE